MKTLNFNPKNQSFSGLYFNVNSLGIKINTFAFLEVSSLFSANHTPASLLAANHGPPLSQIFRIGSTANGAAEPIGCAARESQWGAGSRRLQRLSSRPKSQWLKEVTRWNCQEGGSTPDQVNTFITLKFSSH